MIPPALNRCEVCWKERSDHAGLDHEFKRDATRPEWHGWRAFRRGLATNLHRLGAPDKTIQAALCAKLCASSDSGGARRGKLVN